jgi:hypothetical protein
MALPSAETLEQVSAIGANVATVAAIGIGGWWTYLRFIKNRTGKPQAVITWNADHRLLSDEDRLVRVTVELENKGQVLLSIKCIRCEISQVTPLAPEALRRLEDRNLISDEHLAELGCIRSYDKNFDDEKVQIEPGERDIFPFDFVLSSDISTISIYAHVMNSGEKKNEIGWDLSALFDLPKAKDRPAAE